MAQYFVIHVKQLLTLLMACTGLLTMNECYAKSSDLSRTNTSLTTKYFFKNGATTEYQAITAGDPQNWINVIHNLNGNSASGKVIIKPGSYQQKRDAMHIEWVKCCDMGIVAIFGDKVDFTDYKDNAALRFDTKVHQAPNLGVFVGMDCHHPCSAQYEIAKSLKDAELDTPFTVSIPLSCLQGDNFDLSKVNGVFKISTAGTLEMTITNIRIESLPKSELKCP